MMIEIYYIVNINSVSFAEKIDLIASYAVSVWVIHVHLEKYLKYDLTSFFHFKAN